MIIFFRLIRLYIYNLWYKCFPANALRNIFENIFKWPDEKFGPTLLKSSSSQIFFKIYILKNFATFTEKHLCWNLFLIKLQTWRPATQVLKRDCNTGVFLRILKKIKNSFFIEHFVAAFFIHREHLLFQISNQQAYGEIF